MKIIHLIILIYKVVLQLPLIGYTIFKKKKINSKMVVAKTSNDNSIYSFKNNLEKFIFNLKKNLSRFFSKTLELNSNNNYSVSFFNSKLFKVVKNLDPDIVNLHWICNETISINEVKKKLKKIVWTLTIWPFLAIEHISYNFNKKIIGMIKKF